MRILARLPQNLTVRLCTNRVVYMTWRRRGQTAQRTDRVWFSFFSTVPREIGQEERLQNDLFCVEWDVNVAEVHHPTSRF